MQVHLFRSTGRIFGVTENETGENLPVRLAPWEPFKTIEIVSGVRTPGLDVDECFADLEKYGFHVSDEHVRITDKYV
jgi:hypothetical protein